MIKNIKRRGKRESFSENAAFLTTKEKWAYKPPLR
jgi:hypothetical protein